MLKIKKLLHIRNLEDFLGYKYIFQIIILCFLIFLSTGNLTLRLIAHIFVLFWISINTYQLNTLFKRKNCDFIFYESPIQDDSRYLMFLKGSILENILYYIYILLFYTFFMKGNIYHAIIIATVHYCFSIALGMWFAQLSKNFLGVILIVTFYIYCFAYSSLWTTNEFKRYISPTLQLCNINRINIINTISLITLSIILLLSAKYLKVFYKKYRSLKIAIIICIGISVFVGIISFELSFNKKIEKSKFDTIVVNDKIVKFKGVDEHSVTVLASLLTNVEDQFEKIGIGSESREYQFKKYYVSDFLYPLYKTRPVPIMKEKSIFYINIFSDAMVNFQETDLLRDFINRAFDQIERGINNIDNKYVYQIVEGCREHIYKSAIENNSYISSKDLVEVSEQFISKRNTSSTTVDNFLKKIINIMFDKYMDDIPKLYNLVQNKLPKNNKEFIEIIKEHFPKLLEDSDIKSIIESVVRSG